MVGGDGNSEGEGKGKGGEKGSRLVVLRHGRDVHPTWAKSIT